MNPKLQSLVSDIAVAMFKVASIIKHATLKAELENKAVSLVSNPNSDTIINTANLIVLGREIGEIRPSNSAILIRELETLRKELFVFPAVTEVDISSHFVKNNSDENDDKNIVFPFSLVKTENPNPSASSNKTINPPTPFKSFFNPDKVYQYIVTKKEVKLKELESVFNTISGRTIRRITDSLIKEGKIERVGNPGPTSFYRVPTSPSQMTNSVSQSFTKQNNLQSAKVNNQTLISTTPPPVLISPPSAPAPVISLSAPSTRTSSSTEGFKHLSF